MSGTGESDSNPTDEPDTAVRRRTRASILRSAVSVWSRDFSASLGDIADDAQVSRSTLHRYFPDRQNLLAQAQQDAMRRLEEASVTATANARTAMAEIEGYLEASIEQGDAVIFLFGDPTRFEEQAGGTSEDDANDEMIEVIQRAQQEGAIPADIEPVWVLTLFYSVVYAAAELVSSQTLSLRRACDLAARSLVRGIGA